MKFSPTASAALARNRTGTSIKEFITQFPDSDACLEHIFELRFGADFPCPSCGLRQGWYRVGRSKAFAPRCCYRQRLFPLTDTLFARSNVPLHKWFYAILHFCNAGAGTSGNFLAIQLGISYKAATRMADRIRRHLQAIDEGLRLGGQDVRVCVDEFKLRNVIGPVKGGRVTQRIVMLSDGIDFRFLTVPKGKFREVRKEIVRAVHPGSVLCFRDLGTYQKIAWYRPSLSLPVIKHEIHPDRFDKMFTTKSVIYLRMKVFIVNQHVWVSAESILRYISSFEFVYRRAQAGRSPFKEAIGCFPDIGALGDAK